MVGFRAAVRKPELWDAEQGTIRPAPGWTVAGAHARVPLDLGPGKSVFVVFRHPGTPEPDPYVRAEGPAGEKPEFRLVRFATGADGTTRLRAWTNGPHTRQRASGKAAQIEVAGLPEPVEIPGPWTLRFQPNRGAPAETRLEKLIAWNEHPDPGIRYFSGTATYSIRFDLPPDFLTDEPEVWHDLGEVAVIAEVRLNRRNLGILWHRPFRIEVGKALRPGPNTLEVDVTNLWVNRALGLTYKIISQALKGRHTSGGHRWCAPSGLESVG